MKMLMPGAVCTILVCLFTLAVAISNQERFSYFVRKYGKDYERGSAEYQARFRNFLNSLERHKKLNAISKGPYDAVYGVTKFSDLSEEEFAQQVLGRPQKVEVNPKPNSSHSLFSSVAGIPKFYDLRNEKWPVVTPVKNQEQCGGCWAFSIAETIETQYALKTKKLFKLSVQELIDCTKGGAGCSGGNICSTASWLNETRLKLTTEKNYPFIDDTGVCKISIGGKVDIIDYSCKQYVGDETEMVSVIVNHGPLSVAVDATSWQDYLGGIIQHHCYDGGDNHAVQIIGYDMTGPVPFYIVRNSWGEDWGLDGYLHIKIGDNLCGIANEVVTVTV